MTRTTLAWFFSGAALAALIYSGAAARPVYVILAVILALVSAILSPLGPDSRN